MSNHIYKWYLFSVASKESIEMTVNDSLTISSSGTFKPQKPV